MKKWVELSQRGGYKSAIRLKSGVKRQREREGERDRDRSVVPKNVLATSKDCWNIVLSRGKECD